MCYPFSFPIHFLYLLFNHLLRSDMYCNWFFFPPTLSFLFVLPLAATSYLLLDLIKPTFPSSSFIFTILLFFFHYTLCVCVFFWFTFPHPLQSYLIPVVQWLLLLIIIHQFPAWLVEVVLLKQLLEMKTSLKSSNNMFL